MSPRSDTARVVDPYLDRIGAEQVDALYTNATVGVLGALLGAVVLAGALIALGGLPWSKAAIWIAAGVGCVSFHLVLRFLYRRAPGPKSDWRRWARWFTAAAFTDGIWWGCATIFLAPRNAVDEQLLTTLVAFTVATGAVPAFASYLAAFQAIFFPITALALGWNLVQGGTLHHAAAALVGVFLITMYGLARRSNLSFTQALHMRFDKEVLTGNLRRQKEMAEEANLAKSRFLAAASHDLRQPIHALALFVCALAEYPMNDGMRRLVDHIESSVEAMDGLFSALLDISKLDAGVVEPRPRSFPIAPLLERIHRDYVAEARRKDVRLSLCSSSAFVHSDPVLLERILRNLVSNAVRYTDQGRILVGCRRGCRLSLQVWDTGRGIPADQHDRVFQEFYQVENPERDRGKGLGLGLAIVKRLAALLDHPLGMRSTVGKGSVFDLSLPIADRDACLASSQPDALPPTSRRHLILVLDDEIMVQEAMRSALASWGHDVIVAGSRAEMLAKIAACARCPDLILCDYRLRGNENGIDVIRYLQAEYNEDIPAVLITGDTGSDRLRQARDSGFVVLGKPVAKSRLRATIAHVMNGRVPSAPSDKIDL